MPHTEQDTDLINVIIQDHREVEEAFEELEKDIGHVVGRKDLADHVIAELVRHSVAEEQFMYPAAREKLPDGDEIVDHEIQEHAEAEEIMKLLEGQGPESPHFEQHLAELMAKIRHHIEDEETDLLPRLRQASTAEELQDLGFKVLKAKEFAPTRPHPHAPDRPPANLNLGPGAGVIDKIRDALTGRDV